MSVEAREFRSTAGLFATGVAIIVTEVDSQVHAMTANAVSSLSLDPMLMMFCPSKKARLAQYLAQMRQFTINFLRHDQQALSSYFAGAWKSAPPPPFRFVPSLAGPRLEGALAAIGCESERIEDAGDHWIVIGRVLCVHRGVKPQRPLVFFAGEYRAVDFAHGSPAPDLSQVQDEPPHIFYPH
ncbi:MAG TPA: flavin reductase family protein [Steroidobacteraceae bacterium]|nr:flavin reductase family protein [Steroidobacteraceae bacterium]